MPDPETASFSIPKAYDPKSVEDFWADFWIREKIASPEIPSSKPSYVIVIPPPNVTGSLHMGHALNNTLQDILIRWKKMNGFNTLWVPGTDHGGIATQNVVEKLLKQEKVSRHDLGREKFLERLWQWRRETGDTILMQLRRLGCLLDWERTRFTMDEVCSRAVLEAFSRLFARGWIYRGKRMVNWCVRCHTALSDIEVEFEERKDKLYYLRYPILSGKKDGWQGKPLTVATTRPETMLGDTAVAVHPEDPRYEKIHGWWVQLPLMEREITVIQDEAVDPRFGTGVVKVTPAHDPADFDMGERHHLEQVVVIGFDGKMTEVAGPYAGLSREECRKRVIEDLEKQNLVEKIEDYHHSVGTCYRCGTAVEPLVSDQWFLKVGEMARAAAEATRSQQVRIFPDSWTQPYLSWLDNLKDWCLSRQIWWGHRIPIWYCVPEKAQTEKVGLHPAALTSCPPIASSEEPERCPKCGQARLEQDPDVLDTWFSSALWPFSVFRWPEKTPDLDYFYPTSTLVTGHEILYLWVARMVMFGLTFNPKGAQETGQRIPYRQVFIHGIVRDKHGKKMSKSLGNVVDPLVMMEKYGTDALRFVLASQSVPGRDMQISDDTFVGARNFANKIWNVSRFVLMYLQQARESGFRAKDLAALRGRLELCDRWILSRLQKAVRDAAAALEDYNVAQASRLLYQFAWSEFCDWYVELSKIRVLERSLTPEREAALSVCQHVLSGLLRLLHPILPFITEEVRKNLAEVSGQEGSGSLAQDSFPRFDAGWVDEGAEEAMRLLMSVITEVRTIRSEMGVAPGQRIRLFLNAGEESRRELLSQNARYLEQLCKAESVAVARQGSKPPKSASAVVEQVEAFVPLEGLIDFGKEKARLTKELEQVKGQLGLLEKRLADPQFERNAPQEEVERTRQRRQDSLLKRRRLEEHLEALEAQ